MAAQTPPPPATPHWLGAGTREKSSPAWELTPRELWYFLQFTTGHFRWAKETVFLKESTDLPSSAPGYSGRVQTLLAHVLTLCLPC